MNLKIKTKLPFIDLTITSVEKSITISNVLVDSGSMSTIISTDIAFKIGLNPEPDDIIHTVCGDGVVDILCVKNPVPIRFST